jgi:hypothetical protein
MTRNMTRNMTRDMTQMIHHSTMISMKSCKKMYFHNIKIEKYILLILPAFPHATYHTLSGHDRP